MPTIWYLKSTAASYNPGPGTFRRVLGKTKNTQTSFKFLLLGNSSSWGYGISSANAPGVLNWGTWTTEIKLKVATGDSTGYLYAYPRVFRCSSTGVVVESTSPVAYQRLNSSNTTYTWSIPSKTWNPGGTGERFSVRYRWVNTNPDEGGLAGVSLKFNTSESIVTTAIPTSDIIMSTAPSTLWCEKTTNPVNASEKPNFSAVFTGAYYVGASKINIVVNESSTFPTSLNVATSGWITLTNRTNHAARSQTIFWNNNNAGGTWATCRALHSDPSSGYFWWRVCFASTDASNHQTPWSTEKASFIMTERIWADTTMAFRKKLLFNTSHPLIPPGYTANFKLKTGSIKKVASDGDFNESIANSGGYQISTYGSKTHVVYLAKQQRQIPGYMAINIVSRNNITGLWGTPVKLMDSHDWDTHFFPVLTQDNDGYLYVIRGGHMNTTLFLRSKYSNISGSLTGESAEWINPADNSTTPCNIITPATYPIPLYVPTKDRIYVFVREGNSYPTTQYSFVYTDNKGVSWSSMYTFINNEYGDHDRTYMYGFNYDRLRCRLHIGFTFVYTHKNPQECSVYYAYSDLDETNSESENVGFNIWRWADGSIAGYTDGGGEV
jgi:hypothetical protein